MSCHGRKESLNLDSFFIDRNCKDRYAQNMYPYVFQLSNHSPEQLALPHSGDEISVTGLSFCRIVRSVDIFTYDAITLFEDCS